MDFTISGYYKASRRKVRDFPPRSEISNYSNSLWTTIYDRFRVQTMAPGSVIFRTMMEGQCGIGSHSRNHHHHHHHPVCKTR